MSDPNLGAERRRHARYELFAQVRVQRGREDLIMELVNISQSGALVEMGRIARPRWLEVGRDLQIAITNPDSLALVSLTGCVRRITQDETGTGFAVEFTESDVETTHALEELIALAAATAPPGGPPPLPQP